MIRVKEVPQGFSNLTLMVEEYNLLKGNRSKKLGNYMKNEATKNFIKQTELKSKKFEVCVLVNGQKKHTWGSPDIAKHLALWLNRIDSTPLYRKDLIFSEVLRGAFDGILEIEERYTVCSYVVDFYIPKLNIIIEFDEPYHSRQKSKDLTRQKVIQTVLGCEFIRQVSSQPYEKTINALLKKMLL